MRQQVHVVHESSYLGILVLEHASISGASKKKNRIGDVGDSYGISVSTASTGLVLPPRESDVALS
jgi:hypothetical protein